MPREKCPWCKEIDNVECPQCNLAYRFGADCGLEPAEKTTNKKITIEPLTVEKQINTTKKEQKKIETRIALLEQQIQLVINNKRKTEAVIEVLPS